MDSSKVSETALLQSVRQLARLLTISKDVTAVDSTSTLSTGSGKADMVVPLNPAILETLEKSLKAEVIPMQLHVAVNEISSEVASRYLKGLVSPQLVSASSPVTADRSPPPPPINLLHVNDFSPYEVVKEVEIFASRKVRAIARAFDPGTFRTISYLDVDECLFHIFTLCLFSFF